MDRVQDWYMYRVDQTALVSLERKHHAPLLCLNRLNLAIEQWEDSVIGFRAASSQLAVIARQLVHLHQ